ncbi:ImmA/IrrE family metallo-endopeptidase [Herbaspirillum robiniae]|uniref:ImmA/IrrE family metallo-endopeptidase n=1 Tax=Herbaspirillum robiniae TaxID=2014887 RepID=A0ABX2M2S0_9BURK|nr:ImmA/IrrE family metallo-endopeptidase [Herbaspirillum robiniae]NUU03993.1 ImmA/IrrE family metallo-endopeptidase [Herbaspirillum robiniae]
MTIDFSQLSRAEKLLWDSGVTKPEHIDLDAIARQHNADVVYRPLGGCEARLVAFGERAVISVSSTSIEGRQRFSLGHEIAHWLCDRGKGFLCAKEDIGPQNAEAKNVEAFANAFASQLILPTYLVDPWIGRQPVTLEVAAKLAKDFNTSLTAAAIKLVRRAPAQSCLMCHNQTRLLWRERSIKFPFDFTIAGQLHQDTAAFEIAFTKKSGMSRLTKESADRWFRGSGAYRLFVQSQSTKLPDDSVLSIATLVESR